MELGEDVHITSAEQFRKFNAKIYTKNAKKRTSVEFRRFMWNNVNNKFDWMFLVLGINVKEKVITVLTERVCNNKIAISMGLN